MYAGVYEASFARLPTFQKLTSRPTDPAATATNSPSGENAMLLTPLSGGTVSGAPVTVVAVNGDDQKLNAASSPPAASRLPSGENATAQVVIMSLAVTRKMFGS